MRELVVAYGLAGNAPLLELGHHLLDVVHGKGEVPEAACLGVRGPRGRVLRREYLELRRLVNPQQVYVDLSDKLYDMKSALLEKYSQR
jgi:hypothetical protein